VFVLATGGVVTTELVLDKAFAEGAVLGTLVIELGRETEKDESLCDLEVDLVDASEMETMEGVLLKVAGRDPAVRTVETESDLVIETVDD